MGLQNKTSFFPLAQRYFIIRHVPGMDYRKFLQQPGESLHLPYFGGNSVCDDRQTYRLRQTMAPGWYRFTKSGRYLTPEEIIAPELDTWKLPALTGYVFHSRLIGNDFQGALFGLPTDEDLPKFSPVSARRWFDGHLMYYGPEMESEVEPQVRDAFEAERSLAGIKGIVPALAHVFLLENTQRELAREAERRARDAVERRQQAAALARQQASLEGRIVLALSHTGAELVGWRRNGQRQAEVRYRLSGQRFSCLIDTETLQILDAGICLDGADEELNLSSLPSAVKEAIETGQLHVFRRD